MSPQKSSLNTKSLLWTSFIHVLLGAAPIVIITWAGVMDTVATENGMGHYAERPFSPNLPNWLPMPFNTLINVAYAMIGVYWLTRANRPLVFSGQQSYMCAVFAWMAVLYSLVQTSRIVLQTHRFAVLDQWYTLPIFMWIVVWGLSLMSPFENTFPFLALMITSCFSYFLALISEIGFELGLGAHILLAITTGLAILVLFPSKWVLLHFFSGVICCSGFVILKVFDHHLPQYSPLFRVLSGHFMSKICDIGQIHFSAKFFENAIYVQRKLHLKQL